MSIDYLYYFHLIPLILGVSLVYAGTRCEDVPSILRQGLRIAASIAMFLLVSFLILFVLFG